MDLTVNELITAVRDQLDETNTTNVTDAQILAALNRGQRKGTNIIARKYDSLFVNYTTTTMTSGTRNYTIPAAAYGKRLEKVEVLDSNQNIAWDVQRISFHKTTQYSNSSTSDRPYYYAIKKNEILLYPTPSSSKTIRLWYQDRPETLVTSQGRITSYTDSTTDTIIVDTLGSDLTTDTTDGFNAYINVIDYNTGDIKGSMQISAINTTTKQITLKSSGLTRSTVLGRTISTSLPSDIAVDDYICIVTGTCMPEIPGAYTDYLMQYAVVDIRRRLGENTTEEFAALKDLEAEIQSMWKGREMSHRVRKASTAWGYGLGTSLRRLLS